MELKISQDILKNEKMLDKTFELNTAVWLLIIVSRTEIDIWRPSSYLWPFVTGLKLFVPFVDNFVEYSYNFGTSSKVAF